MNRTKTKEPPAASNTPPESDPYEEGALWAVSVLLSVLNEQRDGAHLIDRMLADAPDDRKQELSDLLRPMGAQLQAGETIYNRVEQRVGRILRERWRAAHNPGKAATP